MGRHRTPQERQSLGEQARAMRAAGRSRREIQAELHIGDDLTKELLRGVALPDSLRRPRAKDELREAARELRRGGATYDEIAAELGVSKSSCSLWLRDLPAPATVRTAAQWSAHAAMMSERRWGAYRRSRDAAVQQRKLDAARSVGTVDDATLLLLGAVAYWCEGAKGKPWRPFASFVFINSDPLLMRLFVRWLQLVDVPPERWVVRVQIHESADVAAAETYWREVLGVEDLVFGKAILKRHRPTTVRKNVGADYHGCASIYVRRGRELLQRVEGLMVGMLLGAGGALPGRQMPWADHGWQDVAGRR